MIYFDNAATAFPKPSYVRQEVLRCLTTYGGNPGRSGHKLSLRTAEMVYDARETACRLLGFAEPERLVFSENATLALNSIIKAYAKPGMHILIGNKEHNAVYRPVQKLARYNNISFDIFDAGKPPDIALTPLLQSNSKLIVLNHVSNVDGSISDIASYGEFAKSHGLHFIVDASQGAGHLPFDYGKIDADAVCAPCHKGLNGIMGAGILYIGSKELPDTFVEGGSGSNSFSPVMPAEMPERYEAGTLPTVAIAAVKGGIEYLNRYGIEQIAAHESKLALRARDILSSFPAIKVYGGESGILSFTAEGRDPEEIAALLDADGICVRGGFHCAPLAHITIGTEKSGTVRISFGIGNRMDELDIFYKSLKSVFSI